MLVTHEKKHPSYLRLLDESMCENFQAINPKKNFQAINVSHCKLYIQFYEVQFKQINKGKALYILARVCYL